MGVTPAGAGAGTAAVVVSPAAAATLLATYDDSAKVEDVAVDSRSPGDKSPCDWLRRQRRRSPAGGPPRRRWFN